MLEAQTNAAPFALYKGHRRYASRVFDQQMANATERFYAGARGKMEQHIGFKQHDEILKPIKSHANYQLKFVPQEDGISFTVSAFFAGTSRIQPAVAFAKTALLIDRICGAVKK